MTPNPATVAPGATIAEAGDLMRELDVRHLPVIEEGALVGMPSDRDFGILDVARLLTEEGNRDTVSRRTDYVGGGDAPGRKLENARRVGVRTLGPAEFEALLAGAR
jgi:hypothetical protein